MKSIKTLLATCLAALWLPSCTNEDLTVAEETGKNTYMAHVTMTADRGMFGVSRSVFEDKKDGTLTFSWQINDVVYLTDTENQYKGTLKVVSVDETNGNRATFEGTIPADKWNGSKDYVFYFFGNNAKNEIGNGAVSEKVYDFSSQNGLLSSLSDDDLLIGKAPINFVDGKGSVNVSFKRQFAYAHYKLIYDGNVLDTKNVEITISADNLAPTASVGFNNGDMVPGVASSFTVTPSANPAPDEEGGFYVALVPNDEETTLTFTCTVGGVNFIGTRTLSKLEKNDFYRLNDGFGAIPIEMNPVKQYRVFYHVNITDIDESDPDGPRVCTSLPYIVSGAEATSYRVLNFTEPKLDDSKERKNEADFIDGYLYDFLGWGTEESANESWASDDLGVRYEANTEINLTKVATEETKVGETTFYDLHLYAKSSVMQYTLIAKRDTDGKYDWMSDKSKNRMTGWCKIQMANYADPVRDGYEFMGWSRKDKNGNLIDKDNPIQKNTFVTIYKDDPCAEWNPDFETTSKHPVTNYARKIKGKLTLTLYPVFKEIENSPVSLPGYKGGMLK